MDTSTILVCNFVPRIEGMPRRPHPLLRFGSWLLGECYFLDGVTPEGVDEERRLGERMPGQWDVNIIQCMCMKLPKT